jgi:hypothetical protein
MQRRGTNKNKESGGSIGKSCKSPAGLNLMTSLQALRFLDSKITLYRL